MLEEDTDLERNQSCNSLKQHPTSALHQVSTRPGSHSSMQLRSTILSRPMRTYFAIRCWGAGLAGNLTSWRGHASTDLSFVPGLSMEVDGYERYAARPGSFGISPNSTRYSANPIIEHRKTPAQLAIRCWWGAEPGGNSTIGQRGDGRREDRE